MTSLAVAPPTHTQKRESKDWNMGVPLTHEPNIFAVTLLLACEVAQGVRPWDTAALSGPTVPA